VSVGRLSVMMAGQYGERPALYRLRLWLGLNRNGKGGGAVFGIAANQYNE
jgi:hypothetical protein